MRELDTDAAVGRAEHFCEARRIARGKMSGFATLSADLQLIEVHHA